MTLRRVGLVSILLIALIVLFSLMGYFYDQNQKEQIRASKNTDLVAYDNAKVVAETVKTLISIRNKDEYNLNRNKFKKIMSGRLYNEYFTTKEYEGGKKFFTIKDNSVTGEIVNKDTYIFKLDLILLEGSSETPVTLLVYIKDNLIYEIKSLG